MKIIAHIPAREESERLLRKNMQLLNGQPLISYAISSALSSKMINTVYVNSESDLILDFAKKFPVKLYKRSKELADSQITQDRFNYDFIKNFECDYFMLINPVCPLIDGQDIENVINFCLKENADTVITTTTHEAHALYKDRPLNFNPNDHLERTQDLIPVKTLNWAINIWKRESFIAHFEKFGHAVFVGKVLYYDLPTLKAIKINYLDDLKLAECILQNKQGQIS